MATATERVDELVKDYLLFRGFTSTLKAFELELKNDKEKGLRADRIIEQLQSYIISYDLTNLYDYWTYLNHRFFSRLEQRYMSSVRKLEVGLLKFYITSASQTKRQDKVIEFFEKKTAELQSQSEFKEWFTFPFVRNPEENSNFAMYFTKNWQDTYFLSLYNFLSVVIQAMPPTLLNFDIDHKRMKNLQEENEMLKTQLLNTNPKLDKPPQRTEPDTVATRGANSMDLVYDFSVLADHDDNVEVEKEQKTSRRFALNFPGSPLRGKKLKIRTSPSKNSDQTNQTSKPETLNKTQVKQKPAVKTSGTSQTKQIKSGVAKIGPVQVQQKGNAGQLDRTGSENTSNQQTFRSQSLSQSQPTHTEPGTSKSTTHPTQTGPSNLETTKILSSTGVQQKQKSIEDHMKERKLLLGDKDPRKSREKRNSEGEVTSSPKRDSQKTNPVPPSRVQSVNLAELGKGEKKSVELTQFPVPDTSASASRNVTELTQFPVPDTSASTSRNITGNGCPFLLLSQEDYSEHRSAISCARFSNTGQYIASVDVDGVVKVWNWSPQPATAATVMSKSAFLSLEWASKSDRWLLLGNRSGNIRLFDVKEMKSFYEASADASYPRIVNLCSNPAGGSFVCSAIVNRARTASVGGASSVVGMVNKVGKLSLWELRTMKVNKILPVEPGPVAVNCCSYNHNGQLLLTGAADGKIRMFDMQQNKCISQWEAHHGEVQSVQFSSDETTCYSMGTDSKFTQWSIHKSGAKQKDLLIHEGACLPFLTSSLGGNKEVPQGKLFAFDSEGQFVLTCDKTVGVLYKVNNSQEGLSRVMEIKGHKSNVTTVDWSPNIDTKICLTGSMDGKVRLSTLLSQ